MLDVKCFNTYIQDMSSLREEIRQKSAFQSLEQEAYLNLIRTATLLSDGIDAVLRPHGLSGAQYNALRILAGAGDDGMCRNEVRDRMVRRAPDMTRLLDRMEGLGLVERERSVEDRRQVGTTITRKGLKLLAEIEDEVNAAHHAQLGHFSRDDLKQLIMLLEQART